MTRISRKKLYGLIIAGILIAISFGAYMVPILPRFTIEGICLLFSALVLWATEALPMSITTMLLICLLALFNIMSFDEAIANIGVNTSLFIMASSGITIAVGNSRIPVFLTRAIISSTRGNSKKMVVGIGFLIAFCSAFMSSLATCALFNGIILSMLKLKGHAPGKSNLGKCMMLAIPACAGIGGFMSPAGTPANILLIDLLSSNGIHITFGQWCMIGFPIGFIAVGLFLAFLILIYPPDNIEKESIRNSKPVEPFSMNDKRTLFIVLTVIAFWFASGWIKSINTTMIAVLGLTAMFLPGIDLLNWDKFSKGVNWDLVLTMGTVSVLMTGISKTEIMSHISSVILSRVSTMPLFLSMFCLSLTVCIIRSFVPTTPAVVALLAPMLIEISSETAFPLINLMFILGFWTAASLLVVYTEPIYLITYGNKYYQGKDLIKVGILPCLLLSAITVLLIPCITKLII